MDATCYSLRFIFSKATSFHNPKFSLARKNHHRALFDRFAFIPIFMRIFLGAICCNTSVKCAFMCEFWLQPTASIILCFIAVILPAWVLLA